MTELQRILQQAAKAGDEVAGQMVPLPEGRDNRYVTLPKLLFSWTEAAWVTGITARTLQRYAKNGQLPVARIGGLTRIRREDLDQLAIAHLQTGSAADKNLPPLHRPSSEEDSNDRDA